MARMTYAEIPLLGDEGGQVASLLKWQALPTQTGNPHLRKDFDEWMPVFPYAPQPQRALNRLYWPTGASRWAMMDCIVDDEQRQEIQSKTNWESANPIAPANLTVDVGNEGFTQDLISVNMYPIAFHPITANATASNPLWFMTLADQRYLWNLTTIEGPYTGDSIAWESLIHEIENEIGVMVDVDEDFDTRLLEAHQQAFQRFLPMSAGVLLDTIAASTARRLVVLPSGTVRMQSADEAIIQFDSNLTNLPRIVGQHQERVTRPSQFSLVLNKGKFHNRCPTWEVFQGTASPEPTFDGEFQFRAFTLHDSDAAGYTNTSEIEDLADVLAEEYSNWGDRRANMTIPGISTWNITGFEDCLVYDCGVEHEPGVRNIHTRIISHSQNFYPTTVYNGNRLIFNEPNWGRLLGGVEGPNSSVSGHNCNYVQVRPSTDCTGATARDPITHYPVVPPTFPLTEGTVKYFPIDSPNCDWFTPTQEDPVPPICYYFSDNFTGVSLGSDWIGDTADFSVDGVTLLQSSTGGSTITLNQAHPHPTPGLTDRIIRFTGLDGTQDGDEIIFFLFQDVSVRITIDQNNPCWHISIEKSGVTVGEVEPIREAGDSGYICYTEDDDGTNATVTFSTQHPMDVEHILFENLTIYNQWRESIQVQRTVVKSPNGNAANEVGIGTGTVLGTISLDFIQVEYIEQPLCECSILPFSCLLFSDNFARVGNIPTGSTVGLGCEWTIINPGFTTKHAIGSSTVELDTDAWATVHTSKLDSQQRFYVTTAAKLDQLNDEFSITFGTNVEARIKKVTHGLAGANDEYEIGIYDNNVSQTNELKISVVQSSGVAMTACYSFGGRVALFVDGNTIEGSEIVAANVAPNSTAVGMHAGNSNSSQPVIVDYFNVSRHKGSNQESCPECADPCTGCQSTTVIHEPVNIAVGTITSAPTGALPPHLVCPGTCDDAGDAVFTAEYLGTDPFTGSCQWGFSVANVLTGTFSIAAQAGNFIARVVIGAIVDPTDPGVDPNFGGTCVSSATYETNIVTPTNCTGFNITLPLVRQGLQNGISGCVYPASVTVTS